MTSVRRDRDVVVAEYLYRHEAEFAAGFLTEAGIPFRLQADDAGGADAGVTFTRPARIWVRAPDAEAARELLEVTPNAAVAVEEDAVGHLDEEEDEEPARGLFVRVAQRGSVDEPDDRGQARGRGTSALCGAERAVAVILGVVFGSLGAGMGDIAPGGQFGTLWTLGMGLLGVAMLVSGLVGRSWGPLRSLLRALSGVAP